MSRMLLGLSRLQLFSLAAWMLSCTSLPYSSSNRRTLVDAEPTNGSVVKLDIFDAGKPLFLSPSESQGRVVARKNYEFAHEAPVWIPESNELFFSTNRLHHSNGEHEIKLFAVELVAGSIRSIVLQPDMPMPNGATPVPLGSGPFPTQRTAVLAYQGYGSEGGGLAYINMMTGETQKIVSDFPCVHNEQDMCQFNSPNDVVVNADHTGLWFTDTSYGFLQDFRDGIPGAHAVYYYDLKTQELRYASRHFDQPNGVLLSPDGKTVYITDAKKKPKRDKRPHRVVAMDIASDGTLSVRAEYPVCGFPDGIKADVEGNLWVATREGVEVLSASGEHLALVHLDGGVANLAFGGKDFRTLLMLNEERIVELQVAVRGALWQV